MDRRTALKSILGVVGSLFIPAISLAKESVKRRFKYDDSGKPWSYEESLNIGDKVYLVNYNDLLHANLNEYIWKVFKVSGFHSYRFGVYQKCIELREEKSPFRGGIIVPTRWVYLLKTDDKTDRSMWAMHCTRINVSVNLGREELFELGRKGPYFRFVNFPAETTIPIEL